MNTAKVNQGRSVDPIWPLVAQREVRVRLRSKMFWVSTVTMVVLIVGGVLALHFLSNRTTTYRVAVDSDTAAGIVTSSAQGTDAAVVGQRFGDRSAAEAAVVAGDADAALLPDLGGTKGWTLEVKGSPDATLEGVLAQAVQVQAIGRNAQDLGVSAEAVTAGATLSVATLDSGADDSNFAWGLSFAFGLLFFLSCQLFGSTTASSVAEEKESRVVEVLLAAIPARAMLIGKIVGNAVLGIAQMALFAAVALLTAMVAGQVPHLSGIIQSSGWFLLYYVIGFVTVCSLFAGLGALASRTQDLQSAVAPVQLIITATYMCAVIGKGSVITIASYIPVASTVTMPSRIFAGTAPWWQVALSLAVAVAFAGLAIWISGRAYRYSVLRMGSRTSLLASLRHSTPPPASAAAPVGAGGRRG